MDSEKEYLKVCKCWLIGRSRSFLSVGSHVFYIKAEFILARVFQKPKAKYPSSLNFHNCFTASLCGPQRVTWPVFSTLAATLNHHGEPDDAHPSSLDAMTVNELKHPQSNQSIPVPEGTSAGPWEHLAVEMWLTSIWGLNIKADKALFDRERCSLYPTFTVWNT